jgi:CBS domain-containing protein
MLAKDIMTEAVISVTPDHSVRHAAQIMLDHRISGLPVIDGGGKIVGMLTEGDLLRRTELGLSASARGLQDSANYIRTHSWRIGDVMTAGAITADENTPIGRLAAIMSASQIKRMPIVRDEKMIGIVSRADILRGIATAEQDTTASGDEAIRRAVLTCLHELQFDPAQVRVTVNNGSVHLWGRVDSESDRKAAHLAAETVGGVGGVVNDLRLVEKTAPDARSRVAG